MFRKKGMEIVSGNGGSYYPLYKSTPILVKIMLAVCIFGLCFPIYGIPYGVPIPGVKFTVFRMGYVLLTLTFLFYRSNIRTRDAAYVLMLFAGFALMRVASLLIGSSDYRSGLQQIVWFLEGVYFLYLVTLLSSRFEDFEQVFLRFLFLIGFISISIIMIQFFLLLVDKVWILPLSESDFGFESHRPWTYPFYGRQIIGPFFEPNMSGTMCALFLAVFLPFVAQKNTDRISLVVKPYWIAIALAVAFIALLGTGSRQAAFVVILAMILNQLRSRQKGKTLLSLAIVTIALLTWQYFSEVSEKSYNVVGETVIERTRLDRERGDVSSGRAYYIDQLLSELTVEMVVFGKGEGRSLHAAHNAYLIVLAENGIVGLFFLLMLSIVLFVKVRKRVHTRSTEASFHWGISSMGVVLGWVFLLFSNWAQLNQHLSYLFLAIPLLFLNKVESRRE